MRTGQGQGKRNIKPNAKCEAKHDFIVRQYLKGISIPKIAQKIKVARGTLYRYMAYTGIREPIKARNGRWERGIY